MNDKKEPKEPQDLRPGDLLKFFEHYLTFGAEFPGDGIDSTVFKAREAFGTEIRRRLDKLEQIGDGPLIPPVFIETINKWRGDAHAKVLRLLGSPNDQGIWRFYKCLDEAIAEYQAYTRVVQFIKQGGDDT